MLALQVPATNKSDQMKDTADTEDDTGQETDEDDDPFDVCCFVVVPRFLNAPSLSSALQMLNARKRR